MPRANELSLHELSYLCGGPSRAVLTALVALYQADHLDLTLGATGSRVIKLVEPPADLDPLEQAVLDAIPAGGVELGSLLTTVARSRAVRQTRDLLVRRGFAGRWPLPGLTQAGRRVRREVRTTPPEGLRRVAAIGSEAIGDSWLRRIFSSPTRRTEPQGVHHTPVHRGAA